MIKRILLILVIFVALALRLYHYLDRTDYGWDQMRDLQVLDQTISSHKLPLLGPIVRGDIGGFYLGPLYHYLLLPFYALSHNPLVLVWISIALDVFVVYFLSHAISLPAGAIWASSLMLANSALTPWNVSLIHLWVILTLYFMVNRRFRPLFFTLGVASSIHLTLLPVVGCLTLWGLQQLWSKRVRVGEYLVAGLLLLVPQITLIISDLDTNFTNLRAFKTFLLIREQLPPTPWSTYLPIYFEKLGMTISRLFFGEPWWIVGLGLTLILVVWGIVHRRRPLVSYSLVIITLILLPLLFYRDPGFAEYYFNALLIPLVILAGDVLLRAFRPVPLTLLLSLLLLQNLRHFPAGPGPFSLGVKRALMTEIAPHLKSRTQLSLLIPEYQQFGFQYFLMDKGITIDERANQTVVVAPSSQEHVPAPVTTPSVIFQTSLAAFRVVVFSN